MTRNGAGDSPPDGPLKVRVLGTDEAWLPARMVVKNIERLQSTAVRQHIAHEVHRPLLDPRVRQRACFATNFGSAAVFPNSGLSLTNFLPMTHD